MAARQPLTRAISIKQPWATLIACGIKSIEIRSWSSTQRGRIFIHAGQRPDPREEAWKLVPAKLRDLTELRGGIVGEATMIDCLAYDSLIAFRRDIGRHFNAPEWFVPPRMHGFVLAEAKPVAFVPCIGKLYFFEPNIVG
jgi:hypothetical protein